jgi:hypothetical protein
VKKATMATRREVVARSKAKYRKSSKKEKGAILDSICLSTGLSRSRVKHQLLQDGKVVSKVHERGRKPKYGKKTIAALRRIWALMDFSCGRRLVVGMGDMLDALIRFDEINLDIETVQQLKEISSATADRLLKKSRDSMVLKGKSTTKPGTLLKRDIPLRLGTEWNDAIPGFVEIDLVAHCGSTAAGDFLHTLDVTDVCTGWTETQSVRNKAQQYVFAALFDIEKRMPFPYRGIDSDNGSEFINDQLYRYCREKNICFTRSRPYQKNDNCYVEQKNWHVVRRNIGYNRYEGYGAVSAMNKYYEKLRLYTNFFLTQMKLIEKNRDGARIQKRYETPQTPYRRILQSDAISNEAKDKLRAQYATLNPAQIKRDMINLSDRLSKLSIRPQQTKEEVHCFVVV